MWACTRDHEIKFASRQREELLATTRDLTLFWLLLAHVFLSRKVPKSYQNCCGPAVEWNEG